MTNVIIENLVQIAATLLITLIGVLGAWLSTKLAKREELKNISTATNEVIHAAQQTVLELQQTTVEGMKKAHADGKLTKDEITELGSCLLTALWLRCLTPLKTCSTLLVWTSLLSFAAQAKPSLRG